MDFNQEVTSIDSVPTEYQGLYAKDGEKFTIKPEVRSIVDAYTGVAKRLTEVEGAKKKASEESISERKARQAYEEVALSIGLTEATPDALKESIQELMTKSKSGKDFQEQMGKMKADYERRIGAVNEESGKKLEAMSGSLKSHLIDKEIASALAKAEGNVDLLSPIIAQKTIITEENGNYSVGINDGHGNARANGKGGHMSIEDFVNELRTNESYAPAFRSKAPGGGGKIPGGGGQRRSNEGELSSTEKISKGLSKR